MRRLRLLTSLSLAAASIVAIVPAPAVALNDPLYERQWGLGIVGAKAAWDRGLFGAGVEVAVVDTGAHLTHQDLVKNVRPGRNLVDATKPPQDDWCSGNTCGHGTHVAGIAVGSIDDGGAVGVAPRAGLIPVKGFGAEGGATSEMLAEGVRWAADQGAEVINMSFGAELPIEGTGEEILSAVRYAWSKGSICVMSAGNDFIFASDISDEPVIVVSATNRRDTEADFSNGVGDAKWALAAPGGGDTIQFAEDENIWSTVWTRSNAPDTYGEMRGTSQAAPFVSGAAALLRAAGLSPQQTVDRLLATAKDLGAAGRDSVYGSGRLDIAKATEGLSAPTSGAPGGGTTPAPTTATTARRAPTTTVRGLQPPPAGTSGPSVTTTTAAVGSPTTSTTVPVLTLEALTPTTELPAPQLEMATGPPLNDERTVPLWLAVVAAVLVLGVTGWAIVAERTRPRLERQ